MLKGMQCHAHCVCYLPMQCDEYLWQLMHLWKMVWARPVGSHSSSSLLQCAVHMASRNGTFFHSSSYHNHDSNSSAAAAAAVIKPAMTQPPPAAIDATAARRGRRAWGRAAPGQIFIKIQAWRLQRIQFALCLACLGGSRSDFHQNSGLETVQDPICTVSGLSGRLQV